MLLKITKQDLGRKSAFHALAMLEHKPQQISTSGSESQEEQRRKLDELTTGCFPSSFPGGKLEDLNVLHLTSVLKYQPPNTENIKECTIAYLSPESYSLE